MSSIDKPAGVKDGQTRFSLKEVKKPSCLPVPHPVQQLAQRRPRAYPGAVSGLVPVLLPVLAPAWSAAYRGVKSGAVARSKALKLSITK